MNPIPKPLSNQPIVTTVICITDAPPDILQHVSFDEPVNNIKRCKLQKYSQRTTKVINRNKMFIQKFESQHLSRPLRMPNMKNNIISVIEQSNTICREERITKMRAVKRGQTYDIVNSSTARNSLRTLEIINQSRAVSARKRKPESIEIYQLKQLMGSQKLQLFQVQEEMIGDLIGADEIIIKAEGSMSQRSSRAKLENYSTISTRNIPARVIGSSLRNTQISESDSEKSKENSLSKVNKDELSFQLQDQLDYIKVVESQIKEKEDNQKQVAKSISEQEIHQINVSPQCNDSSEQKSKTTNSKPTSKQRKKKEFQQLEHDILFDEPEFQTYQKMQSFSDSSMSQGNKVANQQSVMVKPYDDNYLKHSSSGSQHSFLSQQRSHSALNVKPSPFEDCDTQNKLVIEDLAPFKKAVFEPDQQMSDNIRSEGNIVSDKLQQQLVRNDEEEVNEEERQQILAMRAELLKTKPRLFNQLLKQFYVKIQDYNIGKHQDIERYFTRVASYKVIKLLLQLNNQPEVDQWERLNFFNLLRLGKFDFRDSYTVEASYATKSQICNYNALQLFAAGESKYFQLDDGKMNYGNIRMLFCNYLQSEDLEIVMSLLVQRTLTFLDFADLVNIVQRLCREFQEVVDDY